MPKLPFSDFPGSAHYLENRGVLTLRFRLPEMGSFRKKAPSDQFRSARTKKREFFQWARAVLNNGGEEPGPEWETVGEEDKRLLRQVDEDMTVGEAVSSYLACCLVDSPSRPFWMDGIQLATFESRQEPMLEAFREELGDEHLLRDVTPNQIFGFIRALGGKKETKERALRPIRALFTWALKEEHLSGTNPAAGIKFKRGESEEAHDGERKHLSPDQVAAYFEGAQDDDFALDAIYLGRYLATRPHGAALLKWDYWKWDKGYVAVRRRKTRGKGTEISNVDIHPALFERFKHRRGETGYCLVPPERPVRIDWPNAQTLQRMVESHGYRFVGRELGVSDNAIRKRIRRGDGPRSKASRLDVAKLITKKVSAIARRIGLHESGVQPYYALRHTFACASLLEGCPTTVVAAEMGISVVTLERYYFHAISREQQDNRLVNRWGVPLRGSD